MNSFGSKTRLTCLALAVMTATTPLTTQAQAGDPPKVEKTAPKPAAKPEVWKLTVHAKAAQSPALEFSLITRPADQTPGNAAPMYLLAASQAERVKETPVDPAELQRKGLPAAETNELQDYYQSEVPIDRLPVADVKALLAAYDPLFQSFEVAGTRENCNWNLPIRELGFQTTLTHLNGARRLANIVATRARMETAGGEFTLAIRDLRGIFQLGRNLANEGVLIQALVGTGIGAVGANGVREMIQRPDSPNLYWPLATLPRPFISMRDTIEWEHTALLATFPQLRKARTGSFTADDWANLVNNLPNMGNAPPAQNVPPPASATIGPAAAGAMLYPEAKQYLLSRGVAEATVDAMPAPEVLGRYVAEQYQTMFDEMVKWTALPFWQSIGGMQRIEQDLRHPPGGAGQSTGGARGGAGRDHESFAHAGYPIRLQRGVLRSHTRPANRRPANNRSDSSLCSDTRWEGSRDTR